MMLDDKDLEYFGLYLKKGHTHPTPDTRDRTLQVPGMNGSWYFGSDLGNRNFVFPLAFREQDNISLQKRIREFVSFLLDSKGKPREIKLVLDYETDKFYYVRYSGSINPTRLFGKSEFELPLTAYDPLAKFIVPSDAIIMDSDIPIMSDFLWDTGLGSREITSPQSFEIINYGTVAIPFTFRMDGSGNNVVFKANGKAMTFKSFANKTIEITDNYVVKVDEISDLTISNGVFLELLPGVNTITVEGSNLDLTISESLIYQYV